MELLDVYNDKGQKTNKTIERGQKCENILKTNEFIAVSIIYIENEKEEFLIQKTSKEKGGEYSSTGGHIDHNETPLSTIKREVKEELGIDISKDNIIDLGYLHFDYPLRFIFYLKKDINLKDIKIQKEEVESVSYMNIKELKEIIKKGLMNKGHAKALEYVLKYKKRWYYEGE